MGGGKKGDASFSLHGQLLKGKGRGCCVRLQHPVSFSFSKLQIFIPQTTDFHFVSFHVLSLHLVSQSTVRQSYYVFALNHICSKLRLFCFKSRHFCSILLHFCFGYKMKCKTFSFPLFYKPATYLNKHWY